MLENRSIHHFCLILSGVLFWKIYIILILYADFRYKDDVINMESNNRGRTNYHLKKTEPFNFQNKRTVASQMILYKKHEKVSTISNLQKRSIINYLKAQDDYISQQHKTTELSNVKSGLSVRGPISRPNIFSRGGSEPKNRKLSIENKGKSLKYWKQQHQQPKFVTTLKNFFNQLTSDDNGCRCGDNCQVKDFLWKWINVPDELVRKNYNKLLSVLMKIRKTKADPVDHKFSDYMEQESEEDIRNRQKSFNQIKKDIVRTQSSSSAFRNPEVQKKGQRILMCYALEDPELGYVQGMNMVMSGILYHVREEAKTYAVVRELFHELRAIYLNDFRMTYFHVKQCIQLLQENVQDLHEHLMEIGVDLNIVIFPWILSLLSSVVPLDYLHLIYMGYIRHERWEFIYKMIVSIFIYNKEKMKEMQDSSDVLMFLSASNEGVKLAADWADIYEYALRIKF